MSNMTKENAGAAATAPDAQKIYEAPQLPANLIPNWAASHPILALHWGISA